MRLYCETVVQDVLPSLRAMLARELISEYKLSQNEVSKLLNVTQAAVSQYLRSIRGNNRKILENGAIYSEIKSLCQKIYSKELDKGQLASEFCRVCRVMSSVKNTSQNSDQNNCEFHNDSTENKIAEKLA
ncbi:MAG: transcriptional regulator [Candidatus Aenigmatarchaeota archaeon]